jgi:ABC-type molybdate transport system substrate-binding protein
MALTASSTSKTAADFAAYLQSPAAASAFKKQGFSVLSHGR